MHDPLRDPPDPSLLHAPTAAEAGVLRPTRVEVNLDRLAANLRAIRAHVGGRPLMPVLKANAYGHGLVPVARRMEAEGADILAVAYLEEGILLRRAGVRCPILVLGGVVGEQILHSACGEAKPTLRRGARALAAGADRAPLLPLCAGGGAPVPPRREGGERATPNARGRVRTCSR